MQTSPTEIILRDYQREAVDKIFGSPEDNPCVVAPTGSGKSVLIATYLKEACSYFPSFSFLLLTHQKELVEQDVDKLLKIAPTLDIGVYSASLKRKELGHRITFASIQSLYAERENPDIHFDVILVDECHLINNADEGRYQEFFSHFPEAQIIGFTATPFRMGQGRLVEDGHIFTSYINTIGILDLQKMGYLSRLTTKATATTLDTSNVKVVAGEFAKGELDAAVNKYETNQAIAEEIKKKCEAYNRYHVIIFCTSLEHARNITSLLNAMDFSCVCVEGTMSKKEREKTISAFTSGEARAISNVGILCLDEKTEILTNRGFVGIDEMTMDHVIAAWKKDGTIEFTKPELVVKRDRMEGEDMVYLGGRATPKIRVTHNHRMVVRSGVEGKDIKVVPARELVNKDYFKIPTYGYSEPERIEVEQEKFDSSFSRAVATNSYNYRKKGCPPEEALQKATELVTRRRSLRYKNPYELTLDECRFIGFFLGDGSCSNGRFVISQSHAYEDNIEKIDNLLNAIGIHFSRHERKAPVNGKPNGKPYVVWSFSSGRGGDGQIIENSIYPYIPYLKKEYNELFFGLTKEQLSALLEGFWLADGLHHAKRKDMEITKSTYSLLNCLQAVCAMRGISASLSVAKNKEGEKILYTLKWNERRDWYYVPNGEKILETEYKKERVWCVTSTTSFLICRREGKVFVTGNTTGFDFPAIDCVVLIRPTLSTGLYLQMVGRGIRISPETKKKNCLLLDFGENVLRHGPIGNPRVNAKISRKGEGLTMLRVCPRCLEVMERSVYICPSCGYEFPVKASATEKTRYLFYGDPNGDEEVEGKRKVHFCKSWSFFHTQSRAGKDMWVITYYCDPHSSGENTEQVKQYLVVDSTASLWAKKKTKEKLEYIAKKVENVDFSFYLYADGELNIQGLVDELSAAVPPPFVVTAPQKDHPEYTEVIGLISKKEFSGMVQENTKEREMIEEQQKELMK